MRVWYQSFVDPAEQAPYIDRLGERLQALCSPGVTVDVRGISPPDRTGIEGAVVLDGIATVMKATEMAVAMHRLTGVAASRAGLYSRAPEGAVADFEAQAAWVMRNSAA